MTRYLGIDPGLAGALAVLDDGLVDVWDTPTLVVKSAAGRKRHVYVLDELRELLLHAATQLEPRPVQVLAVLEEAGARPGEGVVSSFRSGVGFGIWQGLLAGLAIPFRAVHPATWKTAQGLRGLDKAASRRVAGERFPTLGLGRVKDHGRAEAVLIADFARRAGW